MEKKIKACHVTFSSFTGISLSNITFSDFENKIFRIGRERTDRKFKDTNLMLFKGHFDIDSLNNKKFDTSEFGSKKRCFPSSTEDLERDLLIWNEIKDKENISFIDLGASIQDAISKSKN